MSSVSNTKKQINKNIEKIVQLFEINGELKFLVKWNDSTKSYISSKIMNKSYPFEVIKFYENNICFDRNSC